MFDPKDIYNRLNVRSIVAPLNWELQLRDWPASDLAFIRVFTPKGRSGWVLIAPGSTVESVSTALRAVARRLSRDAGGCEGGNACAI